MRSSENLDQYILDLEQAQADSLALWQEVITADDRSSDDVPLFKSDRDERRSLNLAGRYQVGDGNEFDCEILEISPLGIRIRGPKDGRLGQWCTANISSVGIVEGVVVHAEMGSLTLGIIAPPARIHRLARRLRWQLRREVEQLADRRASERIEMKHAAATLKTSEGRVFSCQIFDISEGGAALHLGANALYFWPDQPISLDERAGHVLRVFPGGFVVKFD